MIAIATVLAFLGYGAAIEGYDNGKVYLGVYTPNTEYGWVATKDSVYLDTVLVKESGYIK
jgi:hypothetical protein